MATNSDSKETAIQLLDQINSCVECEQHLPLGPLPLVQLSNTARIIIIGQAPGKRAHTSGVPWQDPSGDRLRTWLGLTRDDFYDPTKVALMPMGFCYPGSNKSGDKPPRPECAPLWHDRILTQLPDDRLEVIIGRHAQLRYITEPGKNLTETVRNWRNYLPHQIVMPHPSPRNQGWFKTNPWFETDILPAIQRRVRAIIN